MRFMECLVCLEGDSDFVRVEFSNGDTNTISLCEGCYTRFEAKPTVRRIDHMLPAQPD